MFDTRFAIDDIGKTQQHQNSMGRYHRGIDYAAPVGTPVFAAGDGRVTASSYSKANGKFIFIKHGTEYTTKYLHLSRRAVKNGQSVKQGQNFTPRMTWGGEPIDAHRSTHHETMSKEAFDKATGSNKKVLAGVMAILLGGFGIHKFVLGYNKEGIILLVSTMVIGVLTLGLFSWLIWIFTVIEGIIYLTKTDDEFYNTYQVGKKSWF